MRGVAALALVLLTLTLASVAYPLALLTATATTTASSGTTSASPYQSLPPVVLVPLKRFSHNFTGAEFLGPDILLLGRYAQGELAPQGAVLHFAYPAEVYNARTGQEINLSSVLFIKMYNGVSKNLPFLLYGYYNYTTQSLTIPPGGLKMSAVGWADFPPWPFNPGKGAIDALGWWGGGVWGPWLYDLSTESYSVLPNQTEGYGSNFYAFWPYYYTNIPNDGWVKQIALPVEFVPPAPSWQYYLAVYFPNVFEAWWDPNLYGITPIMATSGSHMGNYIGDAELVNTWVGATAPAIVSSCAPVFWEGQNSYGYAPQDLLVNTSDYTFESVWNCFDYFLWGIPNVEFSSNGLPYSGLWGYPIYPFALVATPYFYVLEYNASEKPGVYPGFMGYNDTANPAPGEGWPGVPHPSWPYPPYQNFTITNPGGPMRPTIVVVPVFTVETSQPYPNWVAPEPSNNVWFIVPPAPNYALVGALGVAQVGPQTYWLFVGGWNYTYLDIYQITVVPEPPAYSWATSNETLKVSLVKRLDFSGYGGVTSVVFNNPSDPTEALLGTGDGYLVWLSLPSLTVVKAVKVADTALVSFTNKWAQTSSVAVAPFFTFNATGVVSYWFNHVWPAYYSGQVLKQNDGPFLTAEDYFWGNLSAWNSQSEVVLATWSGGYVTYSTSGLPYPEVSELAVGGTDPEYIYFNNTLYEVVSTGAVGQFNSPIVGVQGSFTLYGVSLPLGSTFSYPVPTPSDGYAFEVTGVSVRVTKIQVLGGQTVHLDLYPFVQDGELSWMLNYNLVNASVPYTKYATVSDLTVAGITYPSFYTQKLAEELNGVGLGQVATHFIVTMADVKLHPPPYFTTGSAWVATTLYVPTYAPLPIYSNLRMTVGIQAYTSVVPEQNDNPFGIIATSVRTGATTVFASSALGMVADGILAYYGTATGTLSGASASLVAAAPVLEYVSDAGVYVGVAIVVWGAVDYALTQWAGFNHAYVQNWIVMAPVFYQPSTGKYYTAVELVLPASEASNVGHYEQVLGQVFNRSGFSGWYIQPVYPFYTWQQLNQSLASGAYQPEVNISALASDLCSNLGIPYDSLVLKGVDVIIITRVHAKDTFWQYVTGPLDYLVATVVGAAYLDVEGTTVPYTITDPSAIASMLSNVTVDGYEVPFSATSSGAVGQVSIEPTDALSVNLGIPMGGYADSVIQVSGFVVWPVKYYSNGTYIGSTVYKWVPLYLGTSAIVSGTNESVVGGLVNDSTTSTSAALIDLAGTEYNNLYFYSARLSQPLGYAYSGTTLWAELFTNASQLGPYVTLTTRGQLMTASDLPNFIELKVSNPTSKQVTAYLYVTVQGVNGTTKAVELSGGAISVPAKSTYPIYVPASAIAGAAAGSSAFINITVELPAAWGPNRTYTVVWAPTTKLVSDVEAAKPLSGVSVYLWDPLNASTVSGTTVLKAGSASLSVVNDTVVVANATGTGSAVAGVVYVGGVSTLGRAVNMTLTDVLNNTWYYVPVIPKTLSYVLPWEPGQGPSNSSAQYEWLTVWVAYSDGGPANATVYVYNITGSTRKLLWTARAGANGLIYFLVPRGTSYNVSAKVFKWGSPTNNMTLTNVTVSDVSQNTLVILEAPAWNATWFNYDLALVRLVAPPTVAGGESFPVPVRLYVYDNFFPSATLNYTTYPFIGSGRFSATLSNGSNVVPATVVLSDLRPLNVTLAVTAQNFTVGSIAYTGNKTWLTAYAKFEVLPVVYVEGFVGYRDVSLAHPPYLLPGDTIEVYSGVWVPTYVPSGLQLEPQLSVSYVEVSKWSPGTATLPQAPIYTWHPSPFTPTANTTYWYNVTTTVPWTNEINATLTATASGYPMVVPLFYQLPILVDPYAIVRLVIPLHVAVAGQPFQITVNVTTNQLPGSGLLWLNIYDMDLRKYILTYLINASPEVVLKPYVTIENNKWLGLIPYPLESHVLLVNLTGHTSVPFTTYYKLLAVDNSFVVFIILALIVVLLIALGAYAVKHAIFDATFRYVRRADVPARKYVRSVAAEWIRRVRYVRAAEEDTRRYVREDRDRKRYVDRA